jgi:hypothetical protein
MVACRSELVQELHDRREVCVNENLELGEKLVLGEPALPVTPCIPELVAYVSGDQSPNKSRNSALVPDTITSSS